MFFSSIRSMKQNLNVIFLLLLHKIDKIVTGPGSTVGCASAWYSDSQGWTKYYFVEIGHEIVFTAILSQLLIQVGQLSDVH